MSYKIDNWVQEDGMFFATITDENDCMVDTLHQIDGEHWLRSGRDFRLHPTLPYIFISEN